MRSTWAEVDLGAVAHNVATLRALVAPAEVCAVVKADGYGHGAVQVAEAALAAGAKSLGVALVEEGAELRAAGISSPIMLFSEPAEEAAGDIVDLGIDATVYSLGVVEALAEAAARVARPLPVHLKVDTGMHRVGVHPDGAVVMAKSIDAHPQLRLASVWTHCASADDPHDPFTATQLTRFDDAVASITAAGVDVGVRHAANSAVAIAHPAGRYDLVRCGIAVYGLTPGPSLAGMIPLRPALKLKSRVAYVKEVDAGECVSYGRHYRLDRPSVIATVPVGYADGVRRALSSTGGQVLVGGVRRPIAGAVTMDQILVDCGDDRRVAVGDEVVLIGGQGDEEITADEWAERVGTISYEIVCGISPRVPRRYVTTAPDHS